MVNESLGNRYGDELLKSVAERLRHNLRGDDLLARLAADEFAVLLPAIESEAAACRVAEKLLEIPGVPFALQGREIYLTASLGISRYPEDGDDAETLLKRPRSPCTGPRRRGADDYQLYRPGMDSHSPGAALAGGRPAQGPGQDAASSRSSTSRCSTRERRVARGRGAAALAPPRRAA